MSSVTSIAADGNVSQLPTCITEWYDKNSRYKVNGRIPDVASKFSKTCFDMNTIINHEKQHNSMLPFASKTIRLVPIDTESEHTPTGKSKSIAAAAKLGDDMHKKASSSLQSVQMIGKHATDFK